jgi:acyl-CoA synthetase (AMP-forming)/AMP-acid ligase II
MTTMLDLLERGEPGHPALVAPGRPDLSYAALRANVAGLAGQLQAAGIGRGDRVAIAMGNGPEMVIAFLAAATAATAAPLNPKYRADEFAFYYDDTRAKALILLPGTLDDARAALLPGMQLIEAQAQSDGTLSFGIPNSQFSILNSQL